MRRVAACERGSGVLARAGAGRVAGSKILLEARRARLPRFAGKRLPLKNGDKQIVSTNEAEQNVIAYLMPTRGLDREGANHLLHGGGLHLNWFGEAEPELRASVVAYKDTCGRGGRRR